MTGARNLKKVCSRTGFALFAMLMVEIVMSVVLVFAYAFISVLRGPNTVMEWFMGYEGMMVFNAIALYIVGAGVFLLILRTVPSGPVVQPAPMKMNPGKYILIFLFCLGASYAASFLMQLVFLPFQGGVATTDVETTAAAIDWSRIIFDFFFLACMPALVEEFLFRYALRKKLGGCSDVTYMFFSALCFSLFHLDIRMIPYTFIVGLVFGWVYAKTGNIWYTISMHFLYNLLGGIVMPMVVEQGGLTGVVIYYVWMGALVILAIVLFAVFFKKIRRTFSPPTEPGWPYKRPRWQTGGTQGTPATAPQPVATAYQPPAEQVLPPVAYAYPPTYGQPQTVPPPMRGEYGPYRYGNQYVSYKVTPGAAPAGYTTAAGQDTVLPVPGPAQCGQGYTAAPPQAGVYPPGAGALPNAQPAYPAAPPQYYPQPPYAPPYGQPQYGQPYPQPYGQQAYAPYPYAYAPYGYAPYPYTPYAYALPVYARPQKPPTAASICIKNAGMITFLSVVGAMSFLTMLSLILMPALANFVY